MKNIRFVVTEEYEGERVDKSLTQICENLSRTYIQKCITEGGLKVNSKTVKANYRLNCDDILEFIIPDAVSLDVEPENIPLEIVYEDDDVAIVNKPRGMVVHPSQGHTSHTLVNALMYHLKNRLSTINGVYRPGIVHRIDKDTSGLLIICKNDKAHENIASQLKEHTAKRSYRAIVHGIIKEETGRVEQPIGRSTVDRKKMAVVKDGKYAATNYRVIERFKNYTYIECILETGRTHQIRVHMSYIGHPLMGDPVYCTKKEPINTNGQMLHAKTIGFVSPSTNKELLFDSELPDDFVKALNYLKSKDK